MESQLKGENMKRTIVVILVVIGLLASGCSTSARFIIPDNTELVVRGQKAERDVQGVYVRMRPFFWTAFGGIDYQLLQQNSAVREGKLSARFRVVSIFWPPYAIIYWPAGFNYSCYDLSRPVPVSCAAKTPPAKEETAAPSGGVSPGGQPGPGPKESKP